MIIQTGRSATESFENSSIVTIIIIVRVTNIENTKDLQ